MLVYFVALVFHLVKDVDAVKPNGLLIDFSLPAHLCSSSPFLFFDFFALVDAEILRVKYARGRACCTSLLSREGPSFVLHYLSLVSNK